MILCLHTWLNLAEGIPVIGDIETAVKSSGYAGVDIFFFLSGMGLVTSMERNSNLLRYYVRRFQKLIFPFWLVAILNLIVNGWSLSTFFKAVSGYSFVFEDPMLILWFVPSISIYFLFFPAYYFLISKFKKKELMILLFFVLSILVVAIVKRYGNTNMHCMFDRLPVFMLGSSLAFLKNNRIKLTRWMFALSLMVLLVCEFYILGSVTENSTIRTLTSRSFPGYLLLGSLIALSLAIILSYLLRHVAATDPVRRILSFFGKISFELYCIQEFFVIIFARLVGVLFGSVDKGIGYFIFNISFFILCVSIAFLIYKLNNFIVAFFGRLIKGVAKQ